jgi:hypothetical protein
MKTYGRGLVQGKIKKNFLNLQIGGGIKVHSTKKLTTVFNVVSKDPKSTVNID